jgi:ferredoxin
MCEEICSQVFFISDLGFVQVADLSAYPEAEVNEVIKYCPADCVEWA